ncbi:MAG: pyridoxamine 5'-phosphate oxidase family protein [Candidatus Zapsychrus exili]|nr:pyridoxamine 5'-phosphate oxidase family protein [Candidatus Zapsychrus exili]
MLEKKLGYFLRKQHFVTLGTANYEGCPHVSPKIFLKFKDKYLYLVDHIIDSSYKNIKENRKVSISTFDMKEVKGFHIYGIASVLKVGKEFEKLLGDWHKKQTQMTARSISDNVSGKKNIRSLKLTFLKPIEIYKIKINRIDLISSEGVSVVEDIK